MTFESACREGFYRALDSDLAKLRYLQRDGYAVLCYAGEPLTYQANDPASVARYLTLLERVRGVIR